MSDIVDCRALAARMIETLTVCDPDFIEALSARFGIDASRTITEIEAFDAGDTEDWGDLPEIHALRYVPLERFATADVSLLITHMEAPDLLLPTARVHLERDPLMEAGHFPGHLLLAAAQLVAVRAIGGHVYVPAPLPAEIAETAAWRELVDVAIGEFWKAFEDRVSEKAIGEQRSA